MYSPITEKGKEFITQIITTGMKPDSNGNTLLMGKNKTPLPYSGIDKMWTCNISYNGKVISTPQELASALIFWFNKHAKNFELDANVIAAQAFVESGYKMWNYSTVSPASGISQFIMITIFSKIIEGYEKKLKDSVTAMNQNDADIISNGLQDKLTISSYQPGNNIHDIAYANRPLLHQNVIDNPEIMIKAQCSMMKSIADKCDSLTSSSLFCYNRGESYPAKTYEGCLQKYYNVKGRDSKDSNEGINYVLTVFGVLGDENNYLVSKGLKGLVKPSGIYFGYDDKYFPNINGKPDPKNLRLKDTWDAFAANVNQSAQYNVSGDAIYPTDYLLTGYMMYYQAISYDAATNGSDRKKHSNIPPQDILNHLIDLGKNIYDPLCVHFGTEIYVSTAYRGDFLNTDVKSKYKTSAHTQGYAMDINATKTKGATFSNSDIFNYIANNLQFNALIWELGNNGIGNAINPEWVHVAYVQGNNARILSIIEGNGTAYNFTPKSGDTADFDKAMTDFKTKLKSLFP